MAAACGELDCPLVQISTDYVFSGIPHPGRPYREDDLPTPQGVYAVTKLEGEQMAAAYPKHLIVRTCGLYARPSDARAKNFVRTMLRLGSSRKQLRVVADQCCTPSYVPDVARAVRFLLDVAGEPAPWGSYHVTNGGAASWHDFAAEVFRLADMPVELVPITTAEYAAAAPRPAYSVLDTTRYHALGGSPMPDWKAALAEYIDEWKGSAVRAARQGPGILGT